jgi:O-acetyl-ADP-ribose deacetylase (regulator of RNase III)
MLYYKSGDIFNSNADVICHQVNCQGVMGAGIAKQVRTLYPKIYTRYVQICKEHRGHTLGRIMLDQVNDTRTICSMFAQEYYGRDKRYTDYNAFRKCLRCLANNTVPHSTIALPYNIGCGLAGGDWNIVLPIIKEELANFTVELWKKE